MANPHKPEKPDLYLAAAWNELEYLSKAALARKLYALANSLHKRR